MPASEMPHHTAPQRRNTGAKRNEKISRETYMHSDPAANASATESRMAAMMAMALPVLMYCERSAMEAPASPQIWNSAAATPAPSNPKTIDTVVDVGSPSVL